MEARLSPGFFVGGYMQDRWHLIEQTQIDWEADRPRMKENNQDLLNCWYYLIGEVEEAGDEVQEIELMKEMGCAVPPRLIDKLANELADVFMFVQQLFSIIGVDMIVAIMDKKAQNHGKHQAKYYNNGRTYEEGRIEAKKYWTETNGYDEWFAVDMKGQPYDRAL